jgi:hypothetical protein
MYARRGRPELGSADAAAATGWLVASMCVALSTMPSSDVAHAFRSPTSGAARQPRTVSPSRSASSEPGAMPNLVRASVILPKGILSAASREMNAAGSDAGRAIVMARPTRRSASRKKMPCISGDSVACPCPLVAAGGGLQP